MSAKILHVAPGKEDVSNGMVVVANFIAKEQGDAEVVDLSVGMHKISETNIEEVWVHGMWLPKEWAVCKRALKLGKRLVRMMHGSLSPIYLKHQSPWKKRLVAPIEKWLLLHANKIVATCEAEADWIRTYEPKVRGIEITDLKRFFNLPSSEADALPKDRSLHLLYLGRQHPLKGVVCLDAAVKDIQGVELRVVSNVFGEEKEKVWGWCDVLILPTLSDNFGLVVAEALERGKRVITTDGAPAWGDGNTYGNRLTYLRGYRDGTPEQRISMLKDAILSLTTSH